MASNKKRSAAIPLADLMADKGKVLRTEANSNTQDDEEALESELEAIKEQQDELDRLDEAQDKEVLNIVKKYNKQRAPLLKRRQECINKVPEFWMRTLLAHEEFEQQYLRSIDQGPLSHLTSVVVEDLDENLQDYRVSFHFKENEYFNNNALWKEFRSIEGKPRVISSEIEWKDTAEAKEVQACLLSNLLRDNDPSPENGEASKDTDPLPENDEASFFSVFRPPADQMLGLGELIKTQIWPNPLNIYMSAEFEEEGDEQEGDEQDEEDEEDEDVE